MRHLILLVLALVLACSSGATTTVNPPPPPPPSPGPPASVSIVSGDAQSALPNAMLAVKLSVVVKDVSGIALAGIAVLFTVDSGGGSLSATSATTGSDGVAVGGDWTLGGSTGAQVVSAKVGTLSAVKFHAQAFGPAVQTLFANVAVGTGGGTLAYTKAGDPLSGLTITIPAGAYPLSTQFTVVADSTAHVPLPADFTQVGPTLVITNTLGFADSAMTLNMPMQLASDIGVAPFYYDPASGLFEGIPMVDRTTTSATLVTHHFSRDLMAIPGNASVRSSVRASLRLGFGAVKIVWVKTPKNKLVGTFNTGFLPGVDNWEFVNNGDYVSPHGDCEGMSLTEMYYHFFHKLQGEPALYHRYDLTLQNVLDNVQGIRFTGSVQGDYKAKLRTGGDQVQRLIDQGLARGVSVEDLTSTWILMTLKLTGNPVLLAVRGTIGGHALVAYSASSTGSHTDVRFADPNFPVSGRTMSFESGQLTPVTLALSGGDPSDIFTQAYALGVSGEIPIISLFTRFDEFLQQKAGADRYPAQYRVEYYDYLTTTWLPLPPTLTTTDVNLSIRHICPSCPSKTTGGAPDEQVMQIWDGAGARKLSDNGIKQNVLGTTQYYARLSAFTAVDPSKEGFVDAIPFTVIYQPFLLLGLANKKVVGDTNALTAVAGALATPGSTFTWTVSDGTAPVTTTGPNYTYRYTKLGFTTIEVALKDAAGKLIAKAEFSETVGVNVTLSPTPVRASPGTPVTIAALVQGGIPANLAPDISYSWYFADASENSTNVKTPGPAVTYTFASAGTYSVSLIVSYKGLQIATVDQVPVQVKTWPGAWRITALTLTSSPPRSSGFPSQWATAWNSIEPWLDHVVQTPSDGMIFLEDNALFTEHAVYFQVAPPGLGKDAIYYVPGSFVTLLARTSAVQFSHYTSTGDLRSGLIDGEGYYSNVFGPDFVVEDNLIQAQKNGTTMTGTFTVRPYVFGGGRTYSFVAVLVTP